MGWELSAYKLMPYKIISWYICTYIITGLFKTNTQSKIPTEEIIISIESDLVLILSREFHG